MALVRTRSGFSAATSSAEPQVCGKRADLAANLDAEAVFELTAKGLDFYAEWLDAPYPYAKYGQVFVPELSCLASEDAGCVLVSEQLLFRSQNDWVTKNTTETLTRIGKQAGLSQPQVEACLKDQSLLDKIAADQKYASEVLKVDSTPTFFINGERIKGETSIEEFEKKINPLLKS